MKRGLFLLCLAGWSLSAQAIDYVTVETATVLYDAPSWQSVKLFVIKRDTPVEIVVNIKDWYKVRDWQGSLAWIEKKAVSTRRSVIVTVDRAEIRRSANQTSALAFEAEKNVSLEYLESAPGGWVKVKHREGQTGFVRQNQIWGS